MKFKETLVVLDTIVSLSIKQDKPLNDVMLMLIAELKEQVDNFELDMAEGVTRVTSEWQELVNGLHADLTAKEEEIHLLKAELNVYHLLNAEKQIEGEQTVEIPGFRKV